MSSNYQVWCLDHQPAIRVASGSASREWSRPAEALDAVANRSGQIALHPECDLIIARESGALIELACPPPGNHGGGHNEAQWVEVEWIRLLIAAKGFRDLNPAMTKAFEQFRQCWNPERVQLMDSIVNERIYPGE